MLKKTTSLLFLLFFIAFEANSQIAVTNTLTPAQLVQNILLGTGVTATNIKYNGSLVNAGIVQENATYFNSTGTLFPLPDGVLLTSGSGIVAVGPNSSSGSTLTGTTTTLVDADLSAIASPTAITNGVKIEFDFVATSDSISFQYVFASEEYPEYAPSTFNDAFGFILSGPGITGPFTASGANIATLPTTTTGTNTVTINNVNATTNPLYYVDNSTSAAYGPAIQFDGSTVILTAAAATICGSSYHIKLEIANVGDQALESGVFLKGGSFTAASNGVAVTSTSISGATLDSLQLQEGCSITQILYIRPVSGIDTAAVFNINTSGTLDPTTDLLSFSNTVTFPIGVDSVIVTINPLNDGLVEPGEDLKIIVYSVSACGDTIFDSLTLFVYDQFNLTFDLPDTLYLNCSNVDTLVEVTNFVGATGPYLFNWSNGSVINPAPFVNTGINLDSTYLTVTVTDGCSNIYLDSVLIINDYITTALSILPNDTLYNSCPTNTLLATLTVDSLAAAPYTYLWSTGSTFISSNVTNPGANGSEIIYYVTTTNACGMPTTDSVLIINDFQTTALSILPNDTLYNPCPSNIMVATLTVDSLASAPYTYLWSTGSTLISSNVTNPGISGSQITYYVTTTNSCGMQSIDSVVVINDFTNPIPTLVPNDTIYTDCILDSALAVVTGSGGASPYTYLWSNSSTNDSTYIFDTIGINGGSINYSVTITDACGNTGIANGVLIVNQTLSATLSQTAATCFPDGTASSVVTGDVGTDTFQWIGPGLVSPDTLTTQNITNISAGWYYYTVTDDVCSFTDSIKVDQIPGPQAIVSGSPVVTSAPATITFMNNSINATNYSWDFGNGLTAISSDLSPQTSFYGTSGIYTITLTAIKGSCIDTATVTIELLDKPVIINVPNVFTPNGDTENDGFYIKTLNVSKLELIIIDRWGAVVFEQTNANPKWNGDDYVDGVYFFMYTATGLNGDILKGNGFLHLIR